MILNDKIRAAVNEVSGLNDFYYNDLDMEAAAGTTIHCPALFRLLRTEDKIVPGTNADSITQDEYFVFIQKVDRTPGGDFEEVTETTLRGLALDFFTKLKKQGVDFTINSPLKWGRRDTANYGIVLLVRVDIKNVAGIVGDCYSQKYLPDPLPSDVC